MQYSPENEQAGENPYEEEDIDIAEIAIEEISALVDGNGARAAEVRLVSKEQETYKFPASLLVELKPIRQDHEKSGRHDSGENVVETEQELEEKIHELCTEKLQEERIRLSLLERFKKEPKEGWGLEGKKYRVDEAREEVAHPQKCRRCNGDGNFICNQCSGQGKINCTNCQAQGKIMCPECKGLKKLVGAGGEKTTCYKCSGFGFMMCPICQTTKTMTCGGCNGQKKMPCDRCGHSGWTTVIADLLFEGETRFEPDTEDLPDELVQAMEMIGYRQLCLNDHADCRRIEFEDREWYEERDREKYKRDDSKQEEEPPYHVDFEATIPFAQAEFSIGGDQYSCNVTGYRGFISHTEDFMDKLIRPGMQALDNLTKGPMATSALIEKAAQYRLIRGVFADIGKYPKKRILKRLMHQYPVGLSKVYAKGCVQFADKALKKITKKPRQNGLGIGIVAAAGLYFAWFGAVRATLGDLPADQMMIADGLVAATGMVLPFYLVKDFATRGLRKVLPKKLSAESKNMQPAGSEGATGVVVALLSYPVAIELTKNFPDWYEPLRAAVMGGG